MRSPPKVSEALDHILKFLRSEGFYAAEDALIRELEERLPGDESPSAAASQSEDDSSPPLIRSEQHTLPETDHYAETPLPDFSR